MHKILLDVSLEDTIKIYTLIGVFDSLYDTDTKIIYWNNRTFLMVETTGNNGKNFPMKYAKERGFTFVPVLYRGPYKPELVDLYISGNSVYFPEEKVREGIVIKAKMNYSIEGNKKALKCINPEYLDDHTNSDGH